MEAPADIKVLELTRVYRNTHRIQGFLSLAMEGWKKVSNSYHVNMSLGQESPGHELLGEEVECVLLPQFSCSLYCSDPVQHLLEDHWSLLLLLNNRLRGQVVEATTPTNPRRFLRLHQPPGNDLT